jgi:hypothetical protein
MNPNSTSEETQGRVMPEGIAAPTTDNVLAERAPTRS